MNEDEEKLVIIRRATFGRQVEQFLNTEVGKYLVCRANDEVAKAVFDFKNCCPTDAVEVQSIQNRMKQGENFIEWISQAVNDGLQALNILEDRE